MTTVIVNDASCLIDLHKVRFLPVMLRLPYRFVVPRPIAWPEMLLVPATPDGGLSAPPQHHADATIVAAWGRGRHEAGP